MRAHRRQPTRPNTPRTPLYTLALRIFLPAVNQTISNMATYNTIPAVAAGEELLLQKPKGRSMKALVAGAAAASFVFGAIAATAVTSQVYRTPAALTAGGYRTQFQLINDLGRKLCVGVNKKYGGYGGRGLELSKCNQAWQYEDDTLAGWGKMTHTVSTGAGEQTWCAEIYTGHRDDEKDGSIFALGFWGLCMGIPGDGSGALNGVDTYTVKCNGNDAMTQWQIVDGPSPAPAPAPAPSQTCTSWAKTCSVDSDCGYFGGWQSMCSKCALGPAISGARRVRQCEQPAPAPAPSQTCTSWAKECSSDTDCGYFGGWQAKCSKCAFGPVIPGARKVGQCEQRN